MLAGRTCFNVVYVMASCPGADCLVFFKTAEISFAVMGTSALDRVPMAVAIIELRKLM